MVVLWSVIQPFMLARTGQAELCVGLQSEAELVQRCLDRLPAEEAESCLVRLDDHLITVDVLRAGVTRGELAERLGFTARECDAVLLDDAAWRSKYESGGEPAPALPPSEEWDLHQAPSGPAHVTQDLQSAAILAADLSASAAGDLRREMHETGDRRSAGESTPTQAGAIRVVTLHLVRGDPLQWLPGGLRSEITGLVVGMRYRVGVTVKRSGLPVLAEAHYLVAEGGVETHVDLEIAELVDATHVAEVCVDAAPLGGEEVRLDCLLRHLEPQEAQNMQQIRSSMRQFSVGIKTMNRMQKVKEQVRSIRMRHAHVDILVADDGWDNEADKYRSAYRVSYIYMGFDKGLSAARNQLVRNASTPFIALMDDDFIWSEQTDVPRAVRRLETSNKSVLTMSIEDTPYEGRLYREEGALHFCPYSKALRAHNRVPGMPTCVDTDIGLNVIVAKRAFLIGHPWPEGYKVGEHMPFFWELKQSAPSQGSGRLFLAQSMTRTTFRNQRR